MKRILSFALVFIITSTGLAQSPDFAWAKQASGTGDGTPTSMALDAGGNIYTTGYFDGMADFDPGPGTYTLDSPGCVSSYVCKLDPMGNFLWARQLGAPVQLNVFADTHCQAINVDSNGDVYLSGYFEGLSDFDPGTNQLFLFAQYGSNAFVVKLTGQGNFVWAKQFRSKASSTVFGMAIDAQDNIYTTGFFTDTTDFDPDVPTFTLSPGGGAEAFISKLDASGNFVWARQLTTGSVTVGNDIALDASGNIYSTGAFAGTADFDPGAGSFTLASMANTQDSYVTKLDAAGNFVWAKQMGGSDIDGGNALTTDAAGNVCVNGFFRSTVDFDPGPASYNLSSNGDYDQFTLKLDAAGNFIWARAIGGTGIDVSGALVTDAAGSVYSTGQFQASVDVDPGPGNTTFSTAGTGIFISKLDAQGNFKWAKELAGSSYAAGTSITLDAVNSVYTAGVFSTTVDFDPNAGAYSLTAFAGTDIYVHKLVCGNPPDLSLSNSSSGIICAGNSTTLTASGAASYTWSPAGPGTNSLVVTPAATTDYTVSGSDANGCKSAASITQSVSACTGIQQLATSGSISLDVYPNPGNGLVTVSAKQAMGLQIQVVNTAGQMVMEETMRHENTLMNITHLPPGLYVVKLNDAQYGTLKTVKLVKE